VSFGLRSIVAVLAFTGIGVHAEPVNIIDELRALPAPSVRMKEIDAASRAAFDAALAEYDRQIEQNPHDILDRLQRCRFMDQFIANYEYAGFVDDVTKEAEQCRAKLVEEHAEHPEVALWELGHTFGDQLLSEGAELQRHTATGTWTAGQSARLYTMLARAADLSDKRDLALQYALRALDLDETADVRLIAATHLIASNDKARALEILTAPVHGDQPQEGWSVAKKMQLLAQLGAYEQAIALHSQLRDLIGYDHTEVARALRVAGANDLARQELKLAVDGAGQYSTDDERELFRFELELGSAEQALTAYDEWRNSGWMEDPLGINRFALFLRAPLLPWQPRDVMGLFGFLGALCAIALVCAVPIAGVHYRGLAVRARSGQPYPTEGWRLRHAWIALCCLGSASLFALYSAGSIDVTASNVGGWAIDATNEQLSRVTLIESLLTIGLLLPFGVVAAARQPLWGEMQWSVAKSCIVALSLALAFRLPLLLAWTARPDSMQQVALDDALWQMIGTVRDQYGLVAALWVVAVTAPVVEEFVFRGVLLRSFAAHLHPGWANVVQAALFSAMHMNLKAAVLLFIFGLVLGALARRSGSLLAPMIMHAAFNLIAALILL
jgi:membrane protease YdiL (CAAX protease family)